MTDKEICDAAVKALGAALARVKELEAENARLREALEYTRTQLLSYDATKSHEAWEKENLAIVSDKRSHWFQWWWLVKTALSSPAATGDPTNPLDGEWVCESNPATGAATVGRWSITTATPSGMLWRNLSSRAKGVRSE